MPASRTNRFLIGAAAAVGVLAGAAGITAAVTGGDGDVQPSLDRAAAEAAAVEAVPGTVVNARTDEEDGRAVWEVDVTGADGTRQKVTVADDGTVVGRDTHDGDGHDDGSAAPATTAPAGGSSGGSATTAPAGSGPATTAPAGSGSGSPALADSAAVKQADAEATALAAAPGTIRSTSIEEEDGRTVWDIEIDGDDGRRHDVHVDATDGSIVEQDSDDEADHD